MSPRIPGAATERDVVVVGAGFAGLYMLYLARQRGFSAVAVEKGNDVGGTWYWNRYPGARCDIPSIEYSYSFSGELQEEWPWTERYASQPEIEDYARHVARRFDLYRDIVFGAEVRTATYDDGEGRWTIDTAERGRYVGRYLVLCSGGLSAPLGLDYEGVDEFAGKVLRTATWPAEGVDLAGQRVGVIGTGSSGVQVITEIAAQVGSLTVFQRTANFSVPNHNRPLRPDELQAARRAYPEIRRRQRTSRSGLAAAAPTRSATATPAPERAAAYAEEWERGGPTFLGAFSDLLVDRDANETAAAFVRDRIREIVQDPVVAERLIPNSHPIGTKRLCLDSGYYAVFNRENVRLVDLRSTPIERLDRDGVVTTRERFDLDVLIVATGFDAVTGSITGIDIRGRDGRSLAEEWAKGPATYLGLTAAGFPNLFFVTGPGSPSVFGNVVVSIEQHVEWVADCLSWMRTAGLGRIEATRRAQEEWSAHVAEVAARTLFVEADSWYVGVNVPGKAAVVLPFFGGVGPYREICDDIAAQGYTGFDTWA